MERCLHPVHDLTNAAARNARADGVYVVYYKTRLKLSHISQDNCTRAYVYGGHPLLVGRSTNSRGPRWLCVHASDPVITPEHRYTGPPTARWVLDQQRRTPMALCVCTQAQSPHSKGYAGWALSWRWWCPRALNARLTAHAAGWGRGHWRCPLEPVHSV